MGFLEDWLHINKPAEKDEFSERRNRDRRHKDDRRVRHYTAKNVKENAEAIDDLQDEITGRIDTLVLDLQRKKGNGQ